MSFAPSDVNPAAARLVRMEAENSAQLLQEASRAWAQLHRAQGEVDRLRGYRNLTPGMKDDQRRWLRVLSDSRATLDRVLGLRR